MAVRVMSEETKNAAEAYRRSRPIFESDPGVTAVCWPTKTGYVWIRSSPDATGHLSGKDEPHRKLYDFTTQRAKSPSSEAVPPDSDFQGVLKAWAEEYERLSPRSKLVQG